MNDDQIYRLIKLILFFLGRLPMGIANYISDSLAMIWYRLDKRHRRVTLENLERAFGEEMSEQQRISMARRVFKNLVRMLFEIAWSYSIDKETLLSHFTFKGLDHARAAQEKGKGIIVITGHMGNFEMLIPAISKLDIKGYGIYRRLDFAPLERLMLESRQRFNIIMMPLRGAAKKLTRILSRGEGMGTLLDQNVRWYKGVFVDFFGHPACTNKGVAALALKTGAAVIPMYTIRHERKFLIEYLPEIPLVETGDPIKDLEINTQNYTTAIESMVRKCPDQYFWVHNRWKSKNYCPLPQK